MVAELISALQHNGGLEFLFLADLAATKGSKDLAVIVSQIEDGFAVRGQLLVGTSMRLRPLVQVELVEEDVRLKQFDHGDFPLDKLDQVVLKQMEEAELVLVLDNVVNHEADRLELVLLQSLVDSRLLVRASEEDGLVTAKVALVTLVQKGYDAPGVKSKV